MQQQIIIIKPDEKGYLRYGQLLLIKHVVEQKLTMLTVLANQQNKFGPNKTAMPLAVHYN